MNENDKTAFSYINIPDDRLFHFNHGSGANEEKSLFFKDQKGILRSIVFDLCASNYHDYNPNSILHCIGERNVEDWSFTFFTSGILTKVIFKKRYYLNCRFKKLFSGNRKIRFERFIKMIEETGYTTVDLSKTP